jgi:hypothetical protein
MNVAIGENEFAFNLGQRGKIFFLTDCLFEWILEFIIFLYMCMHIYIYIYIYL